MQRSALITALSHHRSQFSSPGGEQVSVCACASRGFFVGQRVEVDFGEKTTLGTINQVNISELTLVFSPEDNKTNERQVLPNDVRLVGLPDRYGNALADPEKCIGA